MSISLSLLLPLPSLTFAHLCLRSVCADVCSGPLLSPLMSMFVCTLFCRRWSLSFQMHVAVPDMVKTCVVHLAEWLSLTRQLSNPSSIRWPPTVLTLASEL